MQPMFKTPEERAFIMYEMRCVNRKKYSHYMKQGKKIKEIIFVQSNYCDQFSCEQFVIHFM